MLQILCMYRPQQPAAARAPPIQQNMKTPSGTHPILRPFITGLIAALPLVATVAVFVFLARLLYEWLGPQSLVGSVVIALGFGVAGSEVVGYLLGVVIVAVAIYLLGLLVEAGLQRGLAKLLTNVVQRIPLVRSVYDLIHRFVGLMAQRDEAGLKAMSPVWVHFGGEGGAEGKGAVAVLALLSCPQPVRLGEFEYHAVIVPTAPVPVGGGLLYVPVSWVKPADIGMEALTSLYVSMGVTSPQYLAGGPSKPSA